MGEFKKDMQVGAQGEEVVFEYLSKLPSVVSVEDVRDIKLFQNHDIDFLVYTTQSLILPIEVKSDTMAHYTGNIAYEVFSNKHYNTKGCFEKTRAKYIYYYLTETKELFKIDVQALRKHVREHHNCKRLIPMGDYAEGFLIKIQELEAHNIMTKIN